MVPVWESRGRGCSGLPASLCPSFLVPVCGLFSAALYALNSPGCAGSECFRCSRAWWLFLGVFLWLMDTAFPRCGVRVRSWLQPGRREVSGASALCSLVAPGPGAVPKHRSGGLGVGTVCFSLFVNQALHKSQKELPLVCRGQAGSSCMVVFLFTPLFHHSPVLLSQYQL